MNCIGLCTKRLRFSTILCCRCLVRVTFSLVSAQPLHHDFFHSFRQYAFVVFLRKWMIGRLQEKIWTNPWFLGMSMHFQVQGVWIFRNASAQPGKHRGQFAPVCVIFHRPQDLKVIAAERSPHTPTQCLRGAEDWQMDEPAHKEIFVFNRTVVRVQESLLTFLAPIWQEAPAPARLVVFF